MNRKKERKLRMLAGATLGLSGVAIAVFASVGALPPITIVAALGGLAAMHLVMIAKPGIAVLTYHSVSPAPAWLPWSREISVHPDTFRAHCETLKRMGLRIVGTRDYTALRGSGEPASRDLAIIHLDDGYRDNWQFAAPILTELELPASFFISLDFVEPGDHVRDGDDVSGYMNWPEIQAIEAMRGLEVEPHGIDHARVPVSDNTVDVLTDSNWRSYAWLQWRNITGPKHDWFRTSEPVAVSLGTPVPESDLAFAAPAWCDGQTESPTEFKHRVTEQLALCQTVFSQKLGRVPTVFCWPENKTSRESRLAAKELGYEVTTGGKGRNTLDEPVEVLSRIHMGDRALGFRWLPAERLHLRAAVRLMQGNHYWFAVIGPMNAIRKVVFAWRRKFGADFA